MIFGRRRESTHDSIAAADLLEELRADTNEKTAEVLRRTARRQVADAELGADLVFECNGIQNGAQVRLGLWALDGLVVDTGHDTRRLVKLFILAEPARRLGHEQNSSHVDATQQTLEGNGEAPRKGRVVVADAVVEPIRQHGARGNETRLETDKTAARGTGQLRLQDGHGGHVDTVAGTRSDAAN